MININTGKYTFRASINGIPENEAVFLLHGFPESSIMWSRLQNLLTEKGYYSIAPDQRGYSPGARPSGRKNYTIDLLTEDVINMADSLGIDRFHLIGHDWGSAVGWIVAGYYPERVISWTAMSVPHLNALSHAMRTDDLQHKASEYMRLFQWPLIPEVFLKSGKFTNLINIWDKSSPDEIESYLNIFRQPGAVTAALNWYRANYRSKISSENSEKNISVPTLFIWGRNDPAILKSSADGNKKYMNGPYSEIFIDSGHWLIQESYYEVSSAIVEMLKNNS